MHVVSYTKAAGVGEITIDNPPVNASSHSVRAGLLAAFEAANADTDIGAIVLRCAGRTFVAGADIKEFGKPPLDPHLSVVIHAIESSAKPVVCAIHGTALGGGLEIALGCHFRLALRDARLGLPEVTLGLLPGAGGTQRLPRLIGTAHALDLITSGRMVSAMQAQKLGLVDEVVDADLSAAAVRYAQAIVRDQRPLRRTRCLAADTISPQALAALTGEMRRKQRGMIAPLKCMESVLAASELPFEEGAQQERSFFRELVVSDQARALRHAFFAERESAKIQGIAPGAQARRVERLGVVGAGTMGTGIALAFLKADLPVALLDVDPRNLDKGMGTIREALESDVKKGRMSAQLAQARLAGLTAATDIAAMQDADLIIEAVYEDIDVKKQTFELLDGVAKPDAILVTNTSYLDVNRIASFTKRPESVMGMHFFSPANIMRLVETIRGDRTCDEVLLAAQNIAKRIGKIPVSMKVCDGFVGNRMLTQRTRQAYFLLEEGALPQQVDRVLYDFGFPMGSFQMSDLAGLDVAWRNRKGRAGSLSPREQRCDILDQMYELGRYGQKNHRGFYLYDEHRARQTDPLVDALIAAHSAKVGIARRQIPDQEILERCLYSMINEGARILEEGIVSRPGDIDVVWLHGYGFPRHRGGPMFYADQIGLETVCGALSRYHEMSGDDDWKPSSLLQRLALDGKGFYTA